MENNKSVTAVEWLRQELLKRDMDISIKDLFKQAKEMEREQSYTYDELRTIAYNAYCLGQLNEPTEGKYNLWIQQYKKK